MSKAITLCLTILLIGIFATTDIAQAQTLTISPKNQDTYDNWEPTNGGALIFTVNVSNLSAANITCGKINFVFETVSRWPGICMNKGSGNDPDLYFDSTQTTYTAPRWQQPSGSTGTSTSPSIVTAWSTSDNLNNFSIDVKVLCRDYGAFGILHAKLYKSTSSSTSYVFVKEVTIVIPKDNNGNYMADKSDTEKGYTNPAIDAESGPDDGSGVEENNNYGDGLVEFEEYRGAMTDGVHKRLKPTEKDIFVYSEFTTLGIGDASNLPSTTFKVHEIQIRETKNEDNDRTVNHNSLGTPTQFGAVDAWRVQDTKALWVYQSGYGNYLGKVTREDGANKVGAPPDISRVDVYDTNITNSLSTVQQGTPRTNITANQYIDSVIGHEIGHALKVNHPWHTFVAINGGDPPLFGGWFGFSGGLSRVRLPTGGDPQMGTYSAYHLLSTDDPVNPTYWDTTTTIWTIPVNSYTDDLPRTRSVLDYKYRYGSTVMDYELPFSGTTDANGNTIDREGIFPESTYHRLHNWEYQLLGDGVTSQETAEWTPRTVSTNTPSGGGSDNDEPGEPTNFSVSEGNGQVTLSWDAPSDTGSSGISDYEYRYSGEQNANGEWVNWINWMSAGSDDTEVVIIGLINGTLYAFQVRTKSGTFYSTETDVETEKPSTIPDAPTGLTATGYNGWMNLSWTAPNDGGSTITDYKYQYARSGGSYGSWISAGANTSEPVYGLTNGVLYHFQVLAVNSNGEGPASSTANGRPAGPPGAPQNLETEAGDGEVTLTWSAPLSNNGSTITGYKYSYYAGTSGTFSGWMSVGNVLTATVSDLTNGTLYQFGVLATNSAGDGSYAGPEEATPESVITTPGPPTGLNVSGAINGIVIFTWDEPSDDGGADITGYKYRYREEGTSTWSDWTSATHRVGLITGLTNDTTYEIQVLAINSEGSGEISDILEATPVVVEVRPGAPKDLTATAGDEEVDLYWYPPDFDGNTPITGYEYRLDTNNDGTWTGWTSTGNDTALYVTVMGLTNGTEYAFQVQAKNRIGTGGSSSEVTATPQEIITVPDAPTGLSTTTGTATGTIDLSWDAPSDDGGSPITDYTYAYTKFTNGRWGRWTSFSSTGSTSTSYTVTGLESGELYRFSVLAVNDIGSSRSSRVANTYAR